MRRATVIITLLLLLALSFGVGWLAVYWPHWCQVLDLCVQHAPA